MGLHGHARLTADVDIAVDLAPDAAGRAVHALTAIELRSVGLFVENPIDFDELWAGSQPVDLDGIPVHIASIPDLIRLKRIAGRPQDLADIEALEASHEVNDDP